jgi:hypothetical protein
MSGMSVPKEFYIIRLGKLYLSIYGDWSENIHKARITETLKGAKTILAQHGGFYEQDPLRLAIISQQEAFIERYTVALEAKETIPLVVTVDPEKHQNGYFTFDIKAKKKGES